MQSFRGSSLPAAIVLQWPGAEASAQLLQGPGQASAQQTPSTQKPLPHSAAPPQGWPTAFSPQLPAWQTWPAVQSLSPEQVPRQAPSTQRKGGQSWTPALRQVPSPSQVPAVFIRSPLHDGGTQTVSAA
jgi:hypothetical protein